MTYTTEGVMAQVYVAFGQGTGALRVSQAACLALDARYRRHVNEALLAAWEEIAVHALEQVRTTGRAAASRTALEGSTAISGDTARSAIQTLSDGVCPYCPRVPWNDDECRERSVTTRDGIMAQILVAFGQGTGAIRVSQGACLALREGYHGRIDAEIVAAWEHVAVQVLERMRAIGRLVAAEASLAGGTAIAREQVVAAMQTVERVSATIYCNAPSDALRVTRRTAARALDSAQ